jgi:hypothetical protein
MLTIEGTAKKALIAIYQAYGPAEQYVDGRASGAAGANACGTERNTNDEIATRKTI